MRLQRHLWGRGWRRGDGRKEKPEQSAGGYDHDFVEKIPERLICKFVLKSCVNLTSPFAAVSITANRV